MNLYIYNSFLKQDKIINIWTKKANENEFGAFISFIGLVRQDKNVKGLSFDIHKPLLEEWFDSWQKKCQVKDAICFLAHSLGDVLVNECSYISAISSKHRDVSLSLISDFVEDFKKNAPIWKYDLIDGKRIYANKRSRQIDGAGILK